MKIFRGETAMKKEITQLKNKDRISVNDKLALLKVAEKLYKNVYQTKINKKKKGNKKCRLGRNSTHKQRRNEKGNKTI